MRGDAAAGPVCGPAALFVDYDGSAISSMSLRFEITARCSRTAARAGKFVTPHGEVHTPVFMPVGTQGTVKATSQQELREIGFDMVLANTYHLYLRPGHEIIARAGGLHRFVGWDGPMLTDSGGYQVFSLERLRVIGDDGVVFKSYVDGSEHLFTPERVMEIQRALGADIVMTFDECAPYPCDREKARAAMLRTHLWAERCRGRQGPGQALFGIVQGSIYEDLRTESVRAISEMDFDGVAIGGVSVGEGKELMFKVVRWAAPLLPESKPRYLMGVGTPEDILDAVECGIDMFDCVLPTRLGRNNSLYTTYGRINIKNNRFVEDFGPPDPECGCWACRNYSAAYLRHLYKAEEILASRLATYHNLYFYQKLIEGIREAIRRDELPEFRKRFLAKYRKHRASVHDEDSRREPMGRTRSDKKTDGARNT